MAIAHREQPRFVSHSLLPRSAEAAQFLSWVIEGNRGFAPTPRSNVGEIVEGRGCMPLQACYNVQRSGGGP